LPAIDEAYFADDGPGSLREGCRRREPLWIVFDVSGTIHLSSGVRVSSYKTGAGGASRCPARACGCGSASTSSCAAWRWSAPAGTTPTRSR
jgi:hypothetical protein